MQPVSDDMLLTTAQIAATLIGLLLVGVFFYVETGLRRLTTVGPRAGPFLRATTKLIVLIYSLVLTLSLGLVVLEPVWVASAFVALGAAILISLVEWTGRSRELRRAVPVRGASPWLAWPMVLVPLVVPWAVDGWTPGREALTWTIMVAGAVGFANTAGLLLAVFDLSAVEQAAQEKVRDRRAMSSRTNGPPGERAGSPD